MPQNAGESGLAIVTGAVGGIGAACATNDACHSDGT